MKLLILFLITSSCISCAKLTYLTSQSIEQIKLISTGDPINEVINSTARTEQERVKLQNILKYKIFFSEYLGEELGDTYSKVIFLDRENVSQLVISSSWEQIKPLKECFLVVGCFPYLGFFEKEDAIHYRDKMRKNGFSSHIRPVNAYSTLGHFSDRVLSSFFNYSEAGLANLIFHELVHSKIFFKNGVSFNENIANFIAEELVSIYFKKTINDQDQEQKIRLIHQKVNQMITKKVDEINRSMETVSSNEKKNTMKESIIKNFGNKFRSDLIETCKEHDVKESICLSYDRKWTPSKLAAIGTYSMLQDSIRAYYRQRFTDIRSFYKYLKSEYLKGTQSNEMINLINQKQ